MTIIINEIINNKYDVKRKVWMSKKSRGKERWMLLG